MVGVANRAMLPMEDDMGKAYDIGYAIGWGLLELASKLSVGAVYGFGAVVGASLAINLFGGWVWY